MLSIGSLAFAAPWLLLGLAVLPVLWWLLRAIPPAPKLIPFPAIRLLFGLDPTEETPHRTPWWLLLLRLIIATAVILALAQPLINPGTRLSGSGPLFLVIDDGWAAARDWRVRQEAITELIDQAGRDGKAVMLLTTAPTATGEPLAPSKLMRAGEARRLVTGLEPKPWATDREAALEAIEAVELKGSVNVVWLSDGLDDGAAVALADELQRRGSLRLLTSADADLAVALLPPEIRPGVLMLRALRPASSVAATHTVTAAADDGRVLARQSIRFGPGEPRASVALELPSELRNRIARLSVDGEETAGAVVLVDERFRRRPVGLASGDTAELDQPLLGDLFYLGRALEPYAELRKGQVTELLGRPLAVLLLADIGLLTEAETARVEGWVDGGGVLVRFAGPRLGEGNDTLLPVALRRGGRTFGGVMSWERPARLAPFEPSSLFAGLEAPEDVVVRQQVLAEPAPDLGSKTWARLTDGTPLVTAARRGEGWIVLVHTTANTTWSTLALSGLYVDMLRRIVALSQGIAGDDAGAPLPPLALLDGFGRLTEPTAIATPIPAGEIERAEAGPRTPPGFYGIEGARRALNLGAALDELVPIAELSEGVERGVFGPSNRVDLRPWLLVAALVLLLLDFLIALEVRGLMPRWRSRGAAMGVMVLAILATDAFIGSGRTQSPGEVDEFAVLATREIHLAYVLTGVASIDDTSHAGLVGLSARLAARTSVEPGEPIGINIDRDELAFFPLLYWPMTPEQPPLSDDARLRINDYLRNGGTILFDTRDQQHSGGTGPGTQALRTLIGGLDLPPLVPVPPNHVLTKAFYLIQDFPGRWTGGSLWVQQPDSRVNDGVSPLIIGANDYAAAWALDDVGLPLFPVVPGGERQREMAVRFGINLVMYALTGNYKADQVHVPAILERLGQ